ncbi:GtrA family protein [Schleiferilactobacillus harbinensis]|uniref:GtrA family protein n=1 Tax=Schleiferilactobacillus harbinensis TaxID=304207 RepID=A0ABU7SV91_9LACO|nr:GtrA family protein [Schleiferilactobacillus harbinensis]MCI1686922.1 GtrA family protein [Schleiferilactobacillus harbinensis]MCI1783307.1 GtrA family protein [Schleiferilactobacillus harbinensis]MCI1852009.1 GtrA family protein [Schleiferilactobacillus harbinensis]MCT2907058.1 GtrA family protein [Schleiferilactobacillus harbinensis]GEK05986.1 membrane protein [Schleiferilactobacillus harbinensis]
MKRLITQFIQFGAVGALNTVLTYIIYLILYQHISPTLAMAVGYGLTSLLGLALNKQWVFKQSGGEMSWMTFKYYATYGTTFLLSLILTSTWVDVLHFPAAWAPLFSLAVTVPVNFLLSKYWVFTQKGVRIHASKNSPY